MSSLNFPLSRKRLRSPDFRDSDSEDEDRPLKLRRKYGAKIPLTISSKLRSLLAWVSDLNVTEFFAMAIRNGSKIPQETIIIDDEDDDNEEEEEEEIQEVKRECSMKNLSPFIQRLENQQKSSGKDSKCSGRLFERNGSCSLNSHYDALRISNGSSSYDWDTRHGIGSYSARRSQIDNLKRPALVSNPDTDIEILLGTKPEISAPDTDEIEILSESPSTKQKCISSKKSHRLAARSSVVRNSVSTMRLSQSPKVAVVKPQSVPYTANEVVRLQEKAQYKLLLEKFVTRSHYHHMAKRPQSDAEVQADTSFNSFSGNHFKKEVLQQPVTSFLQRYCKPCQLVPTEKAKELSEKKEPCEIKIDDDESNDEVQILDIKLPEYKPRYRVHCAKYFTKEWLSELKATVSIQTEERQRINELYETDLERFRKERLLNRLRVEGPAQAVEPEFPELTPEMEEAVDQAWNTGAPDDRLCKITSDYLLRKDIETLSGLNWLNDLVINSYFDLIVERSKQEGYPSIHAYNTFFYTTYKAKGYASVRRWTRKLDIFSYDLNFVPIHLGVHWCLAVIDHRSKKVCYYDSMGSGEEQCLDLLHEYLCLEYKDKKGQFLDPTIYTTEIMKDIPQQMNGSDCGMFTLKYAEYISRDAEITFNQGHMQYFRRRMVYELLTSQLL